MSPSSLTLLPWSPLWLTFLWFEIKHSLRNIMQHAIIKYRELNPGHILGPKKPLDMIVKACARSISWVTRWGSSRDQHIRNTHDSWTITYFQGSKNVVLQAPNTTAHLTKKFPFPNGLSYLSFGELWLVLGVVWEGPIRPLWPPCILFKGSVCVFFKPSLFSLIRLSIEDPSDGTGYRGSITHFYHTRGERPRISRHSTKCTSRMVLGVIWGLLTV